MGDHILPPSQGPTGRGTPDMALGKPARFWGSGRGSVPPLSVWLSLVKVNKFRKKLFWHVLCLCIHGFTQLLSPSGSHALLSASGFTETVLTRANMTWLSLRALQGYTPTASSTFCFPSLEGPCGGGPSSTVTPHPLPATFCAPLPEAASCCNSSRMGAANSCNCLEPESHFEENNGTCVLLMPPTHWGGKTKSGGSVSLWTAETNIV